MVDLPLCTMSKKIKEEEEQQDESPFDHLPDHILQLIPQRLCFSDYQLFRQVCPKWRAVVIGNGIDTKYCPPAPQLPLLLVSRSYDSLRTFSINDQFSCASDPKFFPTIDIAYYPPVPQNLEAESITGPIVFPSASLACVGSIGSCLIVAAHQQSQNQNSTSDADSSIFCNPVSLSFLNPVCGARVMLPSQSTLSEVNVTFLFKKIVASSPPGLQVDDCVVAGLFGSGNLAFCRPNDTKWSPVDPEFELGKFSDIELFDGKLYAVSDRQNRTITVFDMSPEDANVPRAHRILNLSSIPFPHLLVDTKWKYPCLAKDSATNELFVVLRNMNIEEGFKVYKTDGKFDNPHGMLRWEPVTDLGDRIMFLSDQNAEIISDKTLGENCIYFAFTSGWNGGFGVYSFKDSSIKPLNFPEEYCSSATTSDVRGQSLWFEFTPNPI